MQKNIDQANAEFWNELCGSTFAQALGIKDHTLSSLETFDRAYFDYYPYLLKHVPVEEFKGKRVLDIGLGYGTLGQKIALSGADYIGLDIAPGPVKMIEHRLRMQGLKGEAKQGSILECPLKNESVDFVVSIGCFHHTGNVQRALDETYRVLKPGGTAILMVYNQLSYKQWLRWPLKTARAYLGRNYSSSEDQRAAYDCTLKGEAAPETAFLSIPQLRKMLSNYSSAKFWKENCDDPSGLKSRLVSRPMLLPWLGKLCGLDIYFRAQK